MTEEISPKTFDLSAALAGRTFPEITVPVFLDEAIQLDLSRLDKKIATATSAEVEELEKERESLLAVFREFALLVKVKGSPKHIRKATLDKINEEFPPKRDAFGRLEANSVADEALATALWSLHVVQITGPDGSVLIPSEADIINFRNNAPDAASSAIESAIQELSTGSKAGYEAAVQDLDFLSQP